MLQLLSAGAAQALVQRVAGARGMQIAGSFGAVGAMLEKFLAGEPCDIVILTQEQIARLASERRVGGYPVTKQVQETTYGW